MKKFLAHAYLVFILLLLYAPLVFIAISSFTESRVLGNWTGFSTKLYSNLFSGSMQGAAGSLMNAVYNTLIIALIAALVATLLGTLAAIGIFYSRGRAKNAVMFLNNIPMVNPDVITGVSLFLLFVFLGISQGYVSVILAHITFCTPYVVLNVLPKLHQMVQDGTKRITAFTDSMRYEILNGKVEAQAINPLGKIPPGRSPSKRRPHGMLRKSNQRA